MIFKFDWAEEINQLNSATTPVTFSWGEYDTIGDQEYTASIIEETIHSITRIPDADHQFPITHSQQLVNNLIGV